jgi:hypothetical protein
MIARKEYIILDGIHIQTQFASMGIRICLHNKGERSFQANMRTSKVVGNISEKEQPAGSRLMRVAKSGRKM